MSQPPRKTTSTLRLVLLLALLVITFVAFSLYYRERMRNDFLSLSQTQAASTASYEPLKP